MLKFCFNLIEKQFWLFVNLDVDLMSMSSSMDVKSYCIIDINSTTFLHCWLVKLLLLFWLHFFLMVMGIKILSMSWEKQKAERSCANLHVFMVMWKNGPPFSSWKLLICLFINVDCTLMLIIYIWDDYLVE